MTGRHTVRFVSEDLDRTVVHLERKLLERI